MTKLFVNGCSITLGVELGEELRYFDESKEGYMAVDHDYRNVTGGLLWWQRDSAWRRLTLPVGLDQTGERGDQR